MDISAIKYDIKIVSGSTLPVNRWAYLEELKQLMQLGVVDDIAVLAETDIRNKENIAQRKSLYVQLQSKIQVLKKLLKIEMVQLKLYLGRLCRLELKAKLWKLKWRSIKRKKMLSLT